MGRFYFPNEALSMLIKVERCRCCFFERNSPMELIALLLIADEKPISSFNFSFKISSNGQFYFLMSDGSFVENAKYIFSLLYFAKYILLERKQMMISTFIISQTRILISL